jgi:hypothetical protein
MPKPLSRSRKSKLEPYTIDELLNNPSMRGLVSFLDVHPEKRTVEKNPRADESATADIVVFPAPGTHVAPEVPVKPPAPYEAMQTVTSRDVVSSDIVSSDLPSPDVITAVPIWPESGHASPVQEAISPVRLSSELTSPDVIEVPPVVHSFKPPTAVHLQTPVPAPLPSRRRVIYVGDRAQNAHTPSENVFYSWVWRHGRPQDEDTRVLALKVPIIAYELNMAERNTRFLIDRMIRKLAIESLPGWIQGQQTGKTYAVYSFRRILERRRNAGLLYALKGKGVELITEEQARQYAVKQTSPILEDYGDEQPETSPDVLPLDPLLIPQRTSRDSNCTTSSDVLADPSLYKSKNTTQETTEPTRQLALLLSAWTTIDDDAVRQIFQSCRRGTPDCTPEEVATFARTKLPLINSGKIDNPTGLLIRTVPKFFENGGSIALKQMRDDTRKRREEDERRALELRDQQLSILEDPNATDEDKEWARQMLSPPTS